MSAAKVLFVLNRYSPFFDITLWCYSVYHIFFICFCCTDWMTKTILPVMTIGGDVPVSGTALISEYKTDTQQFSFVWYLREYSAVSEMQFTTGMLMANTYTTSYIRCDRIRDQNI